MFACLHGHGNLTALASEFSPTVEATGVDTVTFDVAGLDRLFGLPQDVAAAIARRAREIGVKANLAMASNPDAAICAARGFSGVSLIPYGDEAKFLATLPLALLSPTPQLLETLARQSNARTCASLVIECGRSAATWSGTRSVSRLLRGFAVRAKSTHRRKQCSPVFTATAI